MKRPECPRRSGGVRPGVADSPRASELAQASASLGPRPRPARPDGTGFRSVGRFSHSSSRCFSPPSASPRGGAPARSRCGSDSAPWWTRTSSPSTTVAPRARVPRAPDRSRRTRRRGPPRHVVHCRPSASRGSAFRSSDAARLAVVEGSRPTDGRVDDEVEAPVSGSRGRRPPRRRVAAPAPPRALRCGSRPRPRPPRCAAPRRPPVAAPPAPSTRARWPPGGSGSAASRPGGVGVLGVDPPVARS